ncbi:UNVERIFIED_CONTAM: hypothetical protein Sindi_2126400 [Sesamum indicum]
MKADWNLSVRLFRAWSAFGSKFSLFQQRSSRKFIDFVGIFYGTQGGHQLLRRKYAIPRRKAVSVLGTFNLGMLRSLHTSYGTSTARQTRCGCSGSTVSTLEVPRFGTGNQRRGILHSFNDLLISGIGLATRDKLGFLHEEDLCSLCINIKESAKHLFFECPFSNYVWSHIRQWFVINRHMSTLLSSVKWVKKEKICSSIHNKARHLALACMGHTLWRHRNEVIFEGAKPNP